MKISEMPTGLLRELEQRSLDLNAVLGDRRVVLGAVVDACRAEIQRRIEGGDFPELDADVVAKLAAELRCSNAKFVELLYELEE
jgi:hypothetical protein